MAALRTQIDVALHEGDPKKIHETLRSAHDVRDRLTRTTKRPLT